MRQFLILLAVVAAAAAVPAEEKAAEARFVSDLVTSRIEEFAHGLRDKGYDPLIVDQSDMEFSLPVPSIFNVNGLLNNVLVTGVSDIVITRMSYALLTSRLSFDLVIPEIVATVNDASIEAIILSKLFDAKIDGRITIRELGVSGQVRVNIGVISGISVRSLDLNVSLNHIQAEINTISLLGVNYAAEINNYINSEVNRAFHSHLGEFSDLAEVYAWRYIENNL